MCADRRGERGAERGFTLLEVIVALVIASVALVGLFQIGIQGIFASDRATKAEEAIERAQSHLAAFGRTGALAPTELEGEDGGGYRWRLRAAEIAQETAAPEAIGSIGGRQPPGQLLTLYGIEVTVSWQDGKRRRSVVLHTRRLTGRAAGE